jgi:hypothetical protein
MDMEEDKIRRIKMGLKNGEVCFGWLLAQHVITAGKEIGKEPEKKNRSKIKIKMDCPV